MSFHSDCPTGSSQSGTGASTCTLCAAGEFLSLLDSVCLANFLQVTSLQRRRSRSASRRRSAVSHRAMAAAIPRLVRWEPSRTRLARASASIALVATPAANLPRQHAVERQRSCCAQLIVSRLESVPCAPSTFANVTGMSRCLPCAPQSFSDQPARTACTACVAPRFQPFPGRTSW